MRAILDIRLARFGRAAAHFRRAARSRKGGEDQSALPEVEQAFLAPDGLAGRPWFKHMVYAPGSYTGYASEVMPGVTEALDRNDSATLRQEADALSAALLRASARLDEIARLAEAAAPAAKICRAMTSAISVFSSRRMQS